MLVAGSRKCARAAKAAMLEQERSDPSCERMWIVSMRDQTDREARRQSDSVGKAEERRRVRSRRWVRCVSRDEDLGPG